MSRPNGVGSQEAEDIAAIFKLLRQLDANIEDRFTMVNGKIDRLLDNQAIDRDQIDAVEDVVKRARQEIHDLRERVSSLELKPG